VAKALFLSLPVHGHTNPSLPLVRALVERGEDIVYYSAPAFAPGIERTGAAYRAYRTDFLSRMTRLPERMHEVAWLLLGATADVLREELDGFREEQPDYLIVDSVAPWGQWTAELLGIPVVTSISTFAFNRRVLAFGVSRGVRPKSARVILMKIRRMGQAALLQRQLRRRYGARGPGLMGSLMGHSALNIVYTSRHFQPCAETFDDSYQFIGPSMTGRATSGHLPWEQIQPGVLVYVSLGTLFNSDSGFYRTCFEAFRDQPVQVIMSVGDNVSIDSLGPPPANVTVRAHVPQLEVLERASAFVSHGGMNSVCESLYYRVPVLVIPQMGEQMIVGLRVQELGAGLFLAKEKATPAQIRASVHRLLSEDRFRQQARRIRDSFDAAGGVAHGADLILDFTRGTP
jgi:MGT family glycosyltransferase